MAQRETRTALVPFVSIAIVLAFGQVSYSKTPSPVVTSSEYYSLRRTIGEGKFKAALERSLTMIDQHPHEGLLYSTLVEISLYGKVLHYAESILWERMNEGEGVEQCLYGLGLVRYYQQRYAEAAEFFKKAIEYGNEMPDCFRCLSYAEEKSYGSDEAIRRLSVLCHEKPTKALHWYSLGLAYWGKRDYDEALRSFEEAVSLDSNESAFGQARAAVAFLGGRLRDPEGTLFTLLDEAERSSDLSACQFIRSYILMLRSADGDEDGWHTILETTIAEAKEYGLAKWLGWAKEKLADFSLWHAMPEVAVWSATESLTASRLCGDETLIVASSIRLFEAYMELGMYVEASKALLERLSGTSRSKLDPDSVRALLDGARLYHELGQDAFSMAFAVEGIVRAKMIKTPPSLLFLGGTVLGSAYEGLGNTASAERAFKQAEGYAAKSPRNAFFLAIAKGNIGNVYLMEGKLDSAGRMFREEYRRACESDFSREIAYAEVNLGAYWVKRQNDRRAKRHYVTAHRLALDHNLGPVALASASALGKIAVRETKTSEAVRYFEFVARLADTLAGSFVGAQGPTGVQLTGIDACKEVAIGYAKMDRISEAVRWAEESRRREFLTTRRIACRTCGRHVDSVLSVGHMSGYASLAAHAFERADDSADDRIQDLTRLLIAEVNFPRSCDHCSRASKSDAGTLREIYRPPKPPKSGEAIVAFTVSEECLLAIAVTDSCVTARILPVSRLTLRKLVHCAFPIEKNPNPIDRASRVEGGGFARRGSLILYHLLFDSLNVSLSRSFRWTIIADDELRVFPFEALVTSIEGSKYDPCVQEAHFLIEKHEIIYDISIPSLGLQARPKAPRAVLLVGDEEPQKLENDLFVGRSLRGIGLRLPGIKEELDLLKGLFADCSDVLSGEGATKERFLELAPYYSVVHVAAHAMEDLSVPQNCSLGFTPDDREHHDGPDGWTAWEATAVVWRASLVVLSACNTIAGAEGSGPRGFVCALKESGVSSVLGALWEIDDETTPTFMSAFYRVLREGRTSSAALREAKLIMIRDGVSPILWSNFVLYGEDGNFGISGQEELRTTWSRESRLAVLLYALVTIISAVFVVRWGRSNSEDITEVPPRMEQMKKTR